MTRFAGKTALVTGAGSGIGAATCARLTSEGARVWALDRSPIADAALAQDLAGFVLHDLSGAVPDDLLAEIGQLDILVNAAGILHRHAFTEHPVDTWNQTLAVNVKAPFRLSSIFSRQCIERGITGAIVNVCSIESFIAIPAHAAYTASKSALLMMTRAFALELAVHGIRVNGVAPGVTATGMNRTLREDPEASQRLTARIPLGRFGQPEEQASAIAYLASDEASYITGSVLAVDGGWLTN